MQGLASGGKKHRYRGWKPQLRMNQDQRLKSQTDIHRTSTSGHPVGADQPTRVLVFARRTPCLAAVGCCEQHSVPLHGSRLNRSGLLHALPWIRVYRCLIADVCADLLAENGSRRNGRNRAVGGGADGKAEADVRAGDQVTAEGRGQSQDRGDRADLQTLVRGARGAADRPGAASRATGDGGRALAASGGGPYIGQPDTERGGAGKLLSASRRRYFTQSETRFGGIRYGWQLSGTRRSKAVSSVHLARRVSAVASDYSSSCPRTNENGTNITTRQEAFEHGRLRQPQTDRALNWLSKRSRYTSNTRW